MRLNKAHLFSEQRDKGAHICRWRMHCLRSDRSVLRLLAALVRQQRQTLPHPQRSAHSSSALGLTPAPSRDLASTAAWQTTWKVTEMAYRW
jgi:hypothetical protein